MMTFARNKGSEPATVLADDDHQKDGVSDGLKPECGARHVSYLSFESKFTVSSYKAEAKCHDTNFGDLSSLSFSDATYELVSASTIPSMLWGFAPRAITTT